MQTLSSECFKEGSNNNVAECVLEYKLEGNPRVGFIVAPNDMVLPDPYPYAGMTA
jgi:hypothetical protein